MADTEDIQPLVCDNGTGMVKVSIRMWYCSFVAKLLYSHTLLRSIASLLCLFLGREFLFHSPPQSKCSILSDIWFNNNVGHSWNIQNITKNCKT